MDPLSVVALLNEPATYLESGWLSISVPNLVIILVMLLLFVLAVVLPFPKDKDES
jgi:hypothetical protein